MIIRVNSVMKDKGRGLCQSRIIDFVVIMKDGKIYKNTVQ